MNLEQLGVNKMSFLGGAEAELFDASLMASGCRLCVKTWEKDYL